MLHFDLRHDNCIIEPSGTAKFVDWGRACLGAPWVDLVCLLLESDLGGRDEQAVFQSHPLGQQVDDEALDAFAIAGPASYCVERLTELYEMGLRRFYLTGPGRGADAEAARASHRRVVAEVLPAVL